MSPKTYCAFLRASLALLFVSACSEEPSEGDAGAVLVRTAIGYVVSNSDQKLALVSVASDGSLTVRGTQGSWSYGSSVVFLPSDDEPTHAVFFGGTTLTLFKILDSGLPDSTPLATLNAEAAEGYRTVERSPVAGRLVGVQRHYGNAEKTDNISYDLQLGTLTRVNQFTGGRVAPENSLVWNNFFLLLDHLSHGIGVTQFNGDGSLPSSESSFYFSCSSSPSLCPGGYPAGKIVAHPSLPVIYEPSYYHDQLATLNINSSTGALSQADVISTRNRPWGPIVTPSGKWLFLGHVFESGFGVYLQSFSLNQTTGIPDPTAVFEIDLGFTVQKLVLNQAGTHLYVTNLVDSILAAEINQDTGALSTFVPFNLSLTNPSYVEFFTKSISQ